jgi:hypothetical protein
MSRLTSVLSNTFLFKTLFRIDSRVSDHAKSRKVRGLTAGRGKQYFSFLQCQKRFRGPNSLLLYKNTNHKQMHKKSFIISCNTLLHVSTLLGYLQGELFVIVTLRLHFIVEWECAVDCVLCPGGVNSPRSRLMIKLSLCVGWWLVFMYNIVHGHGTR